MALTPRFSGLSRHTRPLDRKHSYKYPTANLFPVKCHPARKTARFTYFNNSIRNRLRFSWTRLLAVAVPGRWSAGRPSGLRRNKALAAQTKARGQTPFARARARDLGGCRQVLRPGAGLSSPRRFRLGELCAAATGIDLGPLPGPAATHRFSPAPPGPGATVSPNAPPEPCRNRPFVAMSCARSKTFGIAVAGLKERYNDPRWTPAGLCHEKGAPSCKTVSGKGSRTSSMERKRWRRELTPICCKNGKDRRHRRAQGQRR